MSQNNISDSSFHITCKYCHCSFSIFPPDGKHVVPMREPSKQSQECTHNCTNCKRNNTFYWYTKDWLNIPDTGIFKSDSEAQTETYGILEIHKQFNFSKIFEIATSNSEISILDTYIPTYPSILNSLFKSLQRNVKVRILVLDPNSQTMKYRSHECGPAYEPKLFAEGLRSYVNQIFSTVSGKDEKNLEMRTYSDLPNMPMYLVKNKNGESRLFFSFFLNTPSFQYPHFEIDGKSKFFKDFYNYFQEKWKRFENNRLSKDSFE